MSDTHTHTRRNARRASAVAVAAVEFELTHRAGTRRSRSFRQRLKSTPFPSERETLVRRLIGMQEEDAVAEMTADQFTAMCMRIAANCDDYSPQWIS